MAHRRELGGDGEIIESASDDHECDILHASSILAFSESLAQLVPFSYRYLPTTPVGTISRNIAIILALPQRYGSKLT